MKNQKQFMNLKKWITMCMEGAPPVLLSRSAHSFPCENEANAAECLYCY